MDDFAKYLYKLEQLKKERNDYRDTLYHTLSNIKLLPENMTLHTLKDEIRDILGKYEPRRQAQLY